MTPKRALVVDDSRSARVALQRLLEKHDLAVSFAESGEEAIEFLKGHEIDVIFMDHSMPGMDGFEAVSVIKADPRTAMIPVMMYTAKEGEVYVGQARALGAVGVLPKQVQAGVLFDMLLKLGLIEERRAGRKRRVVDAANRAPAAPAVENEADRLLERQALGMSIQALITRVLQDQHLELRSDVLASNRDFAKKVAEEIFAKQQAAEEEAAAAAAVPPAAPIGPSARGVAFTLVALFVTAILLLMYSQAAKERDAAVAARTRLAATVDQQAQLIGSLQDELLSGLSAEAPSPAAGPAPPALMDTLQWAANQGNHFAYHELPFDDVRLERLRELLERLAAVGFSGTVRLDAYLGEFCLASDEAGGYRLAAPELSILDCALLGHPLGRSDVLSQGQSVSFANFLASSPLAQEAGIEVQVFAHDSRASARRYPFSPGIRTAGEWNRIAELNNRVEFTLIPTE
jgi:CheY-like chemotaxis protein